MKIQILLGESRALHLREYLNENTNIKAEILGSEPGGFYRVEITYDNLSDVIFLYHAGIDFVNNKNKKPVS